MKTILVTGGAGYIGSHTVKELINQGYLVVVLDNLGNGHREAVNSKAILEVADLKNIDEIEAIFKKHKIEAIVDFAAYLAVGESMSDPNKYFQNNVVNFVNLLDVARKYNCKYLIKSSTAATYGDPTKESDIPWKESHTSEYKPEKSALLEGDWDGEKVVGEEFFQKFMEHYEKVFSARPELLLNDAEKTMLRIPLSIYGLTKLLDEILMKKYDELHQMKTVALRYFNVCGAHEDGDLGDDKPVPTNLMSVAFLQVLGKLPNIKIFGRDYKTPDGTGVRDYIHPSDLATGHIKALEYLERENTSNVFNLGTGNGSSVLEVIKSVEDASGKKVATIDAPRRSGDPSISISDPSHAKVELGWVAKYNLNSMADTAWNWHHTHPNGFGN